MIYAPDGWVVLLHSRFPLGLKSKKLRGMGVPILLTIVAIAVVLLEAPDVTANDTIARHGAGRTRVPRQRSATNTEGDAGNLPDKRQGSICVRE